AHLRIARISENCLACSCCSHRIYTSGRGDTLRATSCHNSTVIIRLDTSRGTRNGEYRRGEQIAAAQWAALEGHSNSNTASSSGRRTRGRRRRSVLAPNVGFTDPYWEE